LFIGTQLFVSCVYVTSGMTCTIALTFTRWYSPNECRSSRNNEILLLLLLSITHYSHLSFTEWLLTESRHVRIIHLNMIYPQLFVGGFMSYLRYLCLLADIGVQHIVWCVFVLFVFVLLPVSLYCSFLIAPSVFLCRNSVNPLNLESVNLLLSSIW